MAVAGKDKRDVQPLASSVELGLLKAVSRRHVFGFGFDECDSDRLRVRVHFYAQPVIDTAPGTLARLAVNDLDGASGFLAANQIFGPATSMQRRIDQLGTGIGFTVRHGA